MQTLNSLRPSPPTGGPANDVGAPGRTPAGGAWRALWAVPAAATLLALPTSPGTWPSLALVAASVLVLHADSITRRARRGLSTRRRGHPTGQRLRS